MSSLRRSSFNERPRRRRRLVSSLSSLSDELPSDPTFDQLNHSSSPPPMDPPIVSLVPSAGAATSKFAETDLESGGIPSALSNPSQKKSGRKPVIPLAALMREEDIPLHRPSLAPWQTVFDESEEDDLPPPVDGFTTVVAPEDHAATSDEQVAAYGNQPAAAINAAAAHLRRRKPSPPISAPPALILFELGSSESGTPQLGQTSTPSSAKYLPLIRDRSQPESCFGLTSSTARYTIYRDHREMTNSQATGPSSAKWVSGKMPVELFEAITQYLSRDDIKSMRLVNKEFERGVSCSLFNTVVVPFNTELYDMIEHDETAKRDLKGKGRADDLDLANLNLQWKNAMEDKEDKLYKGHGLRVFEGFGSHIWRFGMSFEVKEDALRNPPQKKALDQLESYYGTYDWPSMEYTRFEKLAGLERTADETSQMKLAFSHLHKVQHLALCLDSGLGWISGPDKSMRSRILQRSPPVFGDCYHGATDTQQQERNKFWSMLESYYSNTGRIQELKEGRLICSETPRAIQHIQGLSDTVHCDTRSWSSISTAILEGATFNDRAGAQDQFHPPHVGVLYVHPDEPEATDSEHSATEGLDLQQQQRQRPNFPTILQQTRNQWHAQRRHNPHQQSIPATNPVVTTTTDTAQDGPKKTFSPARLDKHQKEWLLEAEWAQRAFLMSYMLAVVDNSASFSRITVLNLARISNRLVPLFSRQDFWDALPNLGDVTLGVIPDWRIVERDEAGFVEAKDIEPSKSCESTYNLLKNYIGVKRSIKKIKVGWVSGGEHAEGCLGRNAHVLPAPITLLPRTVQSLKKDPDMLRLQYVEHLSLFNCWISPPAIVELVRNLEKASLKKITFDSVSLTANPRNATPNGNNNNQNVNHGFFVNALHTQPQVQQNLPAQAQPQIPAPPEAQQFATLFWQGPPAAQTHLAWAQHMLQQMHQMMTHTGIQHHQLAQMWSNHPAGMTLGQIAQTLGMLAGGGVPGMVWTGVQANTVAAATNQGGNLDPAVPPPTAPPPPPAPAVGVHLQGVLPGPNPVLPPDNQQWYEGHREGSWVKVVDALSPGPTLEMYQQRDEFDTAPEKRASSLVSIEFISCGYIHLQHTFFDQTVLENPNGQRATTSYFQKRRVALQPEMLNTPDRYLGRIIQHMPERETDALTFAWGMRMGWQDQKKADEATYDGFLPGGTGRFSGLITKDTKVCSVVERLV